MTQERILAALGVVALVALVGGVAAFAVGGGDEPEVRIASAGTTSSSAVSAPVQSTSTTAAFSPTTAEQTTVTVGIVCTEPEDASKAFIDGWLAGDRAAAERCGAAAAVNTMFQTSGTGAQYSSHGCDRTDPGVPVCSYTYPGGITRLTVEGTEAAGWKVTKVEFTAD